MRQATFRTAGVIAFIFLMACCAFSQTQTLNIWPGAAPGSENWTQKETSFDTPIGTVVFNVVTPTLTVYLPERPKATGTGIIIAPGGAFVALAIDLEGHNVARWLQDKGIAAFVLKYRLGPRYHHPAPLQDAARAIRTVRARATEWNVDPKRIGILGFSAGGHVASTIGTHSESGETDASDPIERVSSRPDLMILIYPVITMRELTHAGSKRMLLGENPSADLVTLLSNEEQVTKETPPAFLVHTANDPAVPVENSLRFAEALKKAGVPFELNVYERGPHGFGLGGKDPILSTWPQRCDEWLRRHGFISPATK